MSSWHPQILRSPPYFWEPAIWNCFKCHHKIRKCAFTAMQHQDNIRSICYYESEMELHVKRDKVQIPRKFPHITKWKDGSSDLYSCTCSVWSSTLSEMNFPVCIREQNIYYQGNISSCSQHKCTIEHVYRCWKIGKLICQTWGTRPRTPDTNKRLLALIAWEYGPNAAGAFSVWTASLLIPKINQKEIDSIRFWYKWK